MASKHKLVSDSDSNDDGDEVAAKRATACAAAATSEPELFTPEDTLEFIRAHSGPPTHEETVNTCTFLDEKLKKYATLDNYFANIEFVKQDSKLAVRRKAPPSAGYSVAYKTYIGPPVRSTRFSNLHPFGNWAADKFAAMGPTVVSAKYNANISSRDSILPQSVTDDQLAFCTLVHNFQRTVLVPAAAKKAGVDESVVIAKLDNKDAITAQWAVKNYDNFHSGVTDYMSVGMSHSVTPNHSYKDYNTESKRTPEEEKLKMKQAKAEATEEWTATDQNPTFYGLADFQSGDLLEQSESKLADLKVACQAFFTPNSIGKDKGFPGFSHIKILTRDGKKALSAQAVDHLSSMIETCIFIPVLTHPFLNSKEPANFSLHFEYLVFAGRTILPGDKITTAAAIAENSGMF